jgi:hypothetical protein
MPGMASLEKVSKRTSLWNCHLTGDLIVIPDTALALTEKTRRIESKEQRYQY